jgi:hypothetical protein
LKETLSLDVRPTTQHVGPAVYIRTMPPRRRRPADVKAARPAKPYLPDGTLDPREWEVACSSAGALALAVLGGEPWFVSARPIEVYEQGVELQVVVRWLSSEVWKAVPLSVDGYVVHVVLEGQTSEIHPIH